MTEKKSSLSFCCSDSRTILKSSFRKVKQPRRRIRREGSDGSWGARYCFHVVVPSECFPITIIEGSVCMRYSSKADGCGGSDGAVNESTEDITRASSSF